VTDDASRNAAGLPPELVRLLQSQDAVQADAAWERFLASHHKLLLYAIRTTEHDRDVVMDCYAYVLEQLRRDDYRRLRAFAAGGRAKFTTWLVTVTCRLALDHKRRRYGRECRTADAQAADRLEARRRLVDLVDSAVDVSELADPDAANPNTRLSEEQRRIALQAALAEQPGRDQLLLSLRFQDDRSAREIADIMGFPSPFHVYRRLKAVLARLRAALEARGIDDAGP
jgi:RNA polymerase sigma factor (sigma-70 family)